jgi:hypothetical protein
VPFDLGFTLRVRRRLVRLVFLLDATAYRHAASRRTAGLIREIPVAASPFEHEGDAILEALLSESEETDSGRRNGKFQ